MRKYLAVIHDSFREAVASRVLWLVLIVITLFLLAVAPLSFREEVTWRLGDSDVRTWPDFLERLRDEGPEGQPPISGHLWSLLDTDLRARMVKVKIPGKDPDVVSPWEFISTMSAFQKAMNRLLERPDFYRPEVWKGVQLLSRELIELRKEKAKQLSTTEQRRFHRLLLEAAYPNLIRSSPPTSIQLTYAWRDLGPPQALRGATFREALQTAAAWVMKWFVGAVGVFVAVLVTAPIIPQMFDPGSLHLLLSKPVGRSLLFLAKYVGGCAFILIGAAYLIGGIWLLLGTRFGVWDTALLVSIPLYLFVFAIYYSVSGLSGVIWRSPIVSIAVTILFFAACWTVGTAKGAFERAVWDKMRITQLLPAKESLITVNEMGMVHAWDEAKQDWREIFASDAQNQMRSLMRIMAVVPHEFRPVGPLYDRVHDRLLSAQPSFPPGKLQLCVGSRDNNWESEPGVAMPSRTFALLSEPDGDILAVSDLDLKRLQGNPLQKQEPLKVFGMTLPSLAGGPFRSVGPEPPLVLTQPRPLRAAPPRDAQGRRTSARRAVLAGPAPAAGARGRADSGARRRHARAADPIPTRRPQRAALHHRCSRWPSLRHCFPHGTAVALRRSGQHPSQSGCVQPGADLRRRFHGGRQAAGGRPDHAGQPISAGLVGVGAGETLHTRAGPSGQLLPFWPAALLHALSQAGRAEHDVRLSALRQGNYEDGRG